MTKPEKDDQFLEEWLTPDELALYKCLLFFSDDKSMTTLTSLDALAEARASISRREKTAEAREQEIRRLSEKCQRTDVTRLPEWPRMVRAIRAYYAEDMESPKRVGNGAFAVECADVFATAVMEAVGPDALVKDAGMEKP